MKTDSQLFISVFTCPMGPLLTFSAGELAELITASRLRYARFQSFATVLNLLAAPTLPTDINPGNTGIFAVNGPHNLDAADDFAATLVEKGEKYVNPIQFPFTLQNSVPCELANSYQFKGPALSVGHNQFALIDALRMASSYLSAGALDQALICSSGMLEPYYFNNPRENNRQASVVNILLSNHQLPGSVKVTGLSPQQEDHHDVSNNFNMNDYPTAHLYTEAKNPSPLLFGLKFYSAFKKALSGITGSSQQFTIDYYLGDHFSLKFQTL